MPTRPNANKISSKTHKWLSTRVYGNLSLLLPQEPCNRVLNHSHMMVRHSGCPQQWGTSPFSRACGGDPKVPTSPVEGGLVGLAQGQVHTPVQSGQLLLPHPTAPHLPASWPRSRGASFRSTDHLTRVSGMTDERKFTQ